MAEEDYQITIPIGNWIYPEACLGFTGDRQLMTVRLPFLGYVGQLQESPRAFPGSREFPFNLGLD